MTSPRQLLERIAFTPPVGRDGELVRLDGAVRAGGVVLGGDAGVGKTRLARAAADRAAAIGCTVRWAAATRSATAIPFGALAQGLPDPAGDGSEDVIGSVRDAARALVEEAGEGRLVLVVDDAHLLDEGSAGLVLQLALTGAATVVATIDAAARWPREVAALWKDGHLERIDVRPLPDADVMRLVEAILSEGAEGETIEAIVNAARGNPLYVAEFVRGAVEDGVLVRRGGAWRLARREPMPGELTDLVSNRLRRLDAGERRLIQLVALAEPLEGSIADRLTDLHTPRAAIERGLITSEAAGRRRTLRLAHPLYGAVALAQLPERWRVPSLVELAGALEQVGARRAEDLLRGVSWRLDADAEQAPGRLLAAAIQAGARFDHHLAARLSQAAIAAGGGLAAVLAYTRACAALGRHAEVERALAPWPVDEMIDAQAEEVLRLRTRALRWGTRDPERADRLLAEAPGWRPEPGWPALVDRVRFDLAEDRGRLREAVGIGRTLLAGGDPATKAAILPRIVGSLALLGRARDASELVEAERRDDQSELWSAVVRIGLLAETGGDPDAAEQDLGRLHELASARGEDRVRAICELMRASIDHARGRARTAARSCGEAALQLALADPDGLRTATLARLAYLYALLGEHRRAAATLGSAEQLVRVRVGSWLEDFELSRARAWIAAIGGTAHDAQQVALAGASRMGEVVQRRVVLLHDAIRLGYPAETLIEEIEAHTAQCDAPALLAIVEHVRALAGDDPGALVQAADRFRSLGYLLHAAESEAAAAARYDRAGAHEPASSAAERSRRLADRCEGARTPALASMPRRGTP